jgi:hypothetical protein
MYAKILTADNPKFRQDLLAGSPGADMSGALEMANLLKVPDGVAVHVVQNTANDWWIVLPMTSDQKVRNDQRVKEIKVQKRTVAEKAGQTWSENMDMVTGPVPQHTLP